MDTGRMDTVKIDRGNTRMIAHRGVSGLETENSIPAFIAAGNRSYYGVETDVHVTKDGRFVILHDDSTGRVAWKDIPVETSDYSQIREIVLKDLCPAAGEGYEGMADRRDLVIPNLQEYIGICKKYGKVCVLELKNEFVPEDIGRLVEEIRALGYLEQVVFISFALSNLACLRELLPGQELYYLTTTYNEEILEAMRKYHLHLDIFHGALTKDTVEALHREGIRVNCWTCDDAEDAGRLTSWGVDYITSNILE